MFRALFFFLIVGLLIRVLSTQWGDVVCRDQFYFGVIRILMPCERNKTFARDLMSNQKARQDSEGTAGKGTKSDLLRMRPD